MGNSIPDSKRIATLERIRGMIRTLDEIVDDCDLNPTEHMELHKQLYALEARFEGAAKSEQLVEQAAAIAEQQALYPDTHTGMRQQWVKGEIARKIRALIGGQ